MTPRSYFSWSSYNLFGQSPKKWKERYLLGEAGVMTPAMAFGKAFAEAREKGDSEGIEGLELFLPVYPRREVEMLATVKVDKKSVVLLGRIDGYDPKKHLIVDDKTGSVPWTQARVDSNEQLTFYAFIYWVKKKRIPKLRLHWIEVELTANKEGWRDIIRPTGRVETFETTRTVKDFVVLMNKIQKRYRGIISLCESEWAKVV